MVADHHHPGMQRRPWLGWVAAILGLVSQLALGSVVLPDTSPAEELASLEAAMVGCAPATTDGTPTPALPHHREGDLALCPLSVTLALPSLVLSPAPVLPPPRQAPAQPTSLRPGARAPPDAVIEAPYPRGPPILA